MHYFRRQYQQKRQYGQYGRRPGAGAGAHGGGRGHRMVFFDPTALIQRSSTQENAPTEEYVPKHTFPGFPLSPQLQKNIERKEYKVLTPIQDQVIPHLLAGKDVVGVASTGTGKTAAFLIPFIHKIVGDPSQKVLIVTPTRELAEQIGQEFRSLSWSLNIFSAVCIGGVGMGQQLRDLSRNPHVVVGTPGRLKDLGQRGKINFSAYKNLVLDEVDRMLDMGFIHDVTHIVSSLPQDRHTAFFSATTSEKIQRVMQQFLKTPVMVSIKSAHAAEHVTQDIVKIQGREKADVLHELLNREGFDKVLVFGRTKRGLEQLARNLRDRGLYVATIHGNKNQNQRQRSLQQFKNNVVKILLATDVASRGIDVKGVTHVINFDLPETYDDYIHRIGRTGRANNPGVAITLVS